MGEYAKWVALRWQRKVALKNYAIGLLQKVHRRLPGAIRRHTGVQSVATPTHNNQWEERAKFMEPLVAARPLPLTSSEAIHTIRVVHLIGSLQPGGAERQLCNCVIGQKALGMDVSVLLLSHTAGEHGHYERLLTEAGVKVRVAGEVFNPAFKKAIKDIPDVDKLLASIPGEFLPWAVDVFGELMVLRPSVFHSWLDHPNVWGGLGALLARVPSVVLSTRNVNPTHFPYLASPYFHAMYQQFARSASVRFINNSHAGAKDYAHWLGLPLEKFPVVLNGVDFTGIQISSDREIQSFRNEVNVPLGAPLVAGVFRLSEEKQPLVFLEVAKRLLVSNLNVYFVIVGIGSYEQPMREFIDKNNLGDRVRMLGRRCDVATIFSAADLKLLCSRQEGTPNVLLEAQWLGCPVLTTRAGGAVDAVKDGETGCLVNVGDVDGLVASASRLLESPALLKKYSEAGPNFIESTFGVSRMVKETMAVYFSERMEF